MSASMEAKRHSLILGGPTEVNIKFSVSFFLSKTISSQTEAFSYKLTRLSHPFFLMQTDTDVNSLKKIILHNAVSTKIKKHFLDKLRIQLQCKLNLYSDIGFNARFLHSRSLCITRIQQLSAFYPEENCCRFNYKKKTLTQYSIN